jgi:hypothetical protein
MIIDERKIKIVDGKDCHKCIFYSEVINICTRIRPILNLPICVNNNVHFELEPVPKTSIKIKAVSVADRDEDNESVCLDCFFNAVNGCKQSLRILGLADCNE